jgi:hypothetical protein
MKPWNDSWNGSAPVPVERQVERGTVQTQCRRGFPLERQVERTTYSPTGTFHPIPRDGTVERAERNEILLGRANCLFWLGVAKRTEPGGPPLLRARLGMPPPPGDARCTHQEGVGATWSSGPSSCSPPDFAALGGVKSLGPSGAETAWFRTRTTSQKIPKSR